MDEITTGLVDSVVFCSAILSRFVRFGLFVSWEAEGRPEIAIEDPF